MKSISLAVLSLLALSACATRPDSVQPKAIAKSEYQNHSCFNLQGTFVNMRDQEDKLSNEMSSTANSQLGMNMLGGVLMATTGIGFARTTNNEGHAQALAAVRGHLVAIREKAQDIACALPETPAAAK